jgi:hypothetical protein
MTPGDAAVMKPSVNFRACAFIARSKTSHSFTASASPVYRTSPTACGALEIRAANRRR